MKKQTIVIFLLMASLIFPVRAQYTFYHFGVENGLSNSFITGALSDNHGSLWVASESGVDRINGGGCRVFNTFNSALPENSIASISYDSSADCVWVITITGKLRIINCQDLSITCHPKTSLLHDADMGVCVTADDGSIWIGYRDGSLQHIDAKEHYTSYWPSKCPGLQHISIHSLADDGAGHLYIGYNNGGFARLDVNHRIARFWRHDASDSNSLPGDNVRSLVFDGWHNLWLGTNNGLACFLPQSGTFLNCNTHNGFASNPSGDNFMSLSIINGSQLWCTSAPGGITVLDLTKFADHDPHKVSMRYILPSTCNLSSPMTRAAVQDCYGNVWIGHYGMGIDVLEHETLPFNILKEGSQQPLRFVYGLSADRNENLWIGGTGELIQYDSRHNFHHYNIIPYIGRATANVYMTYCDNQGRVWLGIDDVGVLYYTPSTGRFTSVKLDKKFIDIHAFFEDNVGRIWIGSEHGIYLFDGTSAHRQNLWGPALSNQVFFAIQQDRMGRMWMGSLGGGLFICDKQLKVVDKLTMANGFPSDNINQLYLDADGSMWVATRSGLVYIKNPARPHDFIVLGAEQGLSDTHVRAITQDALGQIWVSTMTSITRWDIKAKRFFSYDYRHGLPQGGFVESSACTLSDGTIWFASTNGVCWFNPLRISHQQQVTPVYITSAQTEDHNIRIDFTVEDFAQRNLVEYSYIVEGLDHGWQDTQGEDYVSFRNLPSGHYTFRVRARLLDGEWDDHSVASFDFVIPTPLWLRWWAILCYAALVAAVIAVILYYYVRKVKLESVLRLEKLKQRDMQELNDERLRFYTNITHELRTPLTLILGPLEDLSNDYELSARLKQRVNIIHRSALRLLDLINEILEFRKTETQNRRLVVAHGNLSQQVTETGLHFRELLVNNPDLQLQLNIPNDFPELWFDSEIIATILNNLLSNAIKYTPKGIITLSLRKVSEQDTDYAEISVADTGYGIPAADLPHIFDRYYQGHGNHQASGSGIGLALVHSLAVLHQGFITAESVDGQGSVFRLRILMDCSYPDALHKEDTPVAVTASASINESTSTETENNELPLFLIVEDNADIRQYVRESFETSFRIIEAANGKEGLDMALQQIPDIIVSDVMMPEMDGIELCRHLHEDLRTSHIPLILLTAKDSLEDKLTGYDSGADSYLTKPFSAKLLASRIQNLLSARRRLANLIASQKVVGITTSDDVVITSDTCDNTSEKASSVASVTLSQLDRKFMEQLNSILEEKLGQERIDMAYLTQHMNMSTSTFYRKVKALTQLSPVEYVRKFKLTRASQLLLEGEHNISEVIYLTGFNNPGNFREAFKAEFGVSPSEYRKQ